MAKQSSTLNQVRAAINPAYYMDEQTCVNQLLEQAALSKESVAAIQHYATQLVEEIRAQRRKKSLLDAFLYEYDLTSEEGIALMCLAEAMLRIPDKETADALIRDKITSADWAANLGKSDSTFVNASTWALMLTGKVLANSEKKNFASVLKQLIRASGEPFIRAAVGQAMKILGNQFVMGRTIDEALKNAKTNEEKGYRHSYDMLGEAARTQEDAEYYFDAYCQAITAISKYAHSKIVAENPGISVKLSALHPRYEFAKREEVVNTVAPKLLHLAKLAKEANIGLTVDAEEARVLDLSLDIIENVFSAAELAGWEGFGLAVQSYQKRAPFVIDWLVALSKQYQRRIMIRLIKGAYWDSEVKYAQVNCLPGYPVFTRKNSTDVSFLACAKKILQHPETFYAQFGTHNAYSVAAILELTNGRTDFEFQCLHGMGHALYDLVVLQKKVPCRIYAPVGGHKELLAYLVRRLLENGANTSFVNRIADETAPIVEIIADPIARISALENKAHPRIPLPIDIYGASRKNSKGIDFSNRVTLQLLQEDMQKAEKKEWIGQPIINGKKIKTTAQAVFAPFATHEQIGQIHEAGIEQVELALKAAEKAEFAWSNKAVDERAQCLLKAADLLEENTAQLMAILIREAGKTLPDAIAEVREAVDFCRYYAEQAKLNLVPKIMPGPTGELNTLSMHGRGTFVCISPWNFPLAIFMGQITAALVAGNPVIAKPAEQTCLIATRAIELLHEAGVPEEVLHLLPGKGEIIGAALVEDRRVKGVIFTGSTETARAINLTLAKRPGPIVPFIAETGGQNAMIVDSSALLEQVVMDVLTSAFGSAGQRCSALRVVYVQNDIADKFITMLKGAMAELIIGNPSELRTDVGPVIDQEALAMLEKHFAKMSQPGKLIYQVNLPAATNGGYFFAPCAFEIASIKELEREVFGPCLHVRRYQASKLNEVLDEINGTGYGLTQGIHTRINEKAETIIHTVHAGNIYVNRNMIGAVVGVQPFGGEGLSGTGPKAGGPHYLYRLVAERMVTVDTTASGGNASLLMLTEV